MVIFPLFPIFRLLDNVANHDHCSNIEKVGIQYLIWFNFDENYYHFSSFFRFLLDIDSQSKVFSIFTRVSGCMYRLSCAKGIYFVNLTIFLFPSDFYSGKIRNFILKLVYIVWNAWTNFIGMRQDRTRLITWFIIPVPHYYCFHFYIHMNYFWSRKRK